MMNKGLRCAPPLLLCVLTAALLFLYGAKLDFNLMEAIRVVLGLAALWVPLGACLEALLKKEILDTSVRLAFSAACSYALTTLFYFFVASLAAGFLLYLAQVAAAGMAIVLRRKSRIFLNFNVRRIRLVDTVLPVLVAGSLLSSVRTQTIWQEEPKGGATYVGFPDLAYHAGLSYELARHVPPLQATIRGGVAERPYHHFMHLTVSLMARYTGQTDMLRVLVVYHHATLVVLNCLLLYSIGKTLTKSRVAGWIGCASMYVAVATGPNLWRAGGDLPFFYFTVFPYKSSGLDPVAFTSPQMHAGLVLLFTTLLGVGIHSRCLSHGQQARVVLILTSLAVAATTRYRIHIALAVLPWFELLCLLRWWRTRKRIHLAAFMTTSLVFFLLILETKLPTYLPGTSQIKFAYSALGDFLYIPTWPFSSSVHAILDTWIANPEVRKWLWEYLSVSLFVLCNMIGLPLFFLSGWIASSRRARLFSAFTYLIVAAIGTSVVLGPVLVADYDSYSLGCQLLLHTSWYLFPLTGVAIWRMWLLVKRRIQLPAILWTILAGLAFGGFTWHNLFGPPSPLSVAHSSSIKLSPAELSALSFLNRHAPPDAVIASSKFTHLNGFLLSGLSGRSSYLEAPGNPVDRQAMILQPSDDRLSLIKAIWSATTNEELAALLKRTPITHLIEHDTEPLKVSNLLCMVQFWSSSESGVRVWEVKR